MDDIYLKSIADLPEQVGAELDALIEGNKRFVEGDLHERDYCKLREDSYANQNPPIILLTCADSRLMSHHVFDATLGDLFILRNPGNMANEDALAGIDFAVKTFEVKLLVIMGHSNCGMVQAAIRNEQDIPSLIPLIEKLKPAVEEAEGKSSNQQKTQILTAQENVKNQMIEAYNKSEILRNAVLEEKVAIVGAYYDLQTGYIDFWEKCIFGK
jgi:carbonic anhydrase